jgi:hypothetical protein
MVRYYSKEAEPSRSSETMVISIQAIQGVFTRSCKIAKKASSWFVFIT